MNQGDIDRTAPIVADAFVFARFVVLTQRTFHPNAGPIVSARKAGLWRAHRSWASSDQRFRQMGQKKRLGHKIEAIYYFELRVRGLRLMSLQDTY